MPTVISALVVSPPASAYSKLSSASRSTLGMSRRVRSPASGPSGVSKAGGRPVARSSTVSELSGDRASATAQARRISSGRSGASRSASSRTECTVVPKAAPSGKLGHRRRSGEAVRRRQRPGSAGPLPADGSTRRPPWRPRARCPPRAVGRPHRGRPRSGRSRTSAATPGRGTARRCALRAGGRWSARPGATVAARSVTVLDADLGTQRPGRERAVRQSRTPGAARPASSGARCRKRCSADAGVLCEAAHQVTTWHWARVSAT